MPEHGLRKNGAAQEPPRHVSKAPKPRGRAKRHYRGSAGGLPHYLTVSLGNEWDKHLVKNAAAVDVLNSNRQLWHSAFGPDPESLGNPTEGLLEQCSRSVVILNAMLEKHGPRGGLDSHVQDITSAVKMLKVVSWDAIRKDRFSLTPQASSVHVVRAR